MGLRGRCEATSAPTTENAVSQATSSKLSTRCSPEGAAPGGRIAPQSVPAYPADRTPASIASASAAAHRLQARTRLMRPSSPSAVREVLRRSQSGVRGEPARLEPGADDVEVALEARRYGRVRERPDREDRGLHRGVGVVVGEHGLVDALAL